MDPELFSLLRIPVTLAAGGDKPTLPTEFMVCCNGETETLKGPIRCSEFSCQRVVDAMRAAGRDKLPFDYNHGQVAWLGGDGRAAGWFVPASRDGALWATQIEWTPRARAELDAKEWRYFSPALFRDDNGNITELVNIALTNLPATLNQTPLVASQFGRKDPQDMTLEQLLVSLGAKDPVSLSASYTGLQAQVTKLSADNAQLLAAAQTQTAQLTAAQTELVSLKASIAGESKKVKIAALSAAGKLPPALHKWAEGQTEAQLDEYAAGCNVQPVAAAATVTTPAAPVVTLSADERSICKQMGLDPVAYQANKAALAASRAAGDDPHVIADMGLPTATAQKVAA